MAFAHDYSTSSIEKGRKEVKIDQRPPTSQQVSQSAAAGYVVVFRGSTLDLRGGRKFREGYGGS